jgi:hypothetical protein
MSNIVNDIIMDNLRDKVHELWVIEGRPDLEDDCLDYCYENIHTPVPLAMIEFLSKHCMQAMSTKDYEFARDEHNKKVLSNLKEMRNNHHTDE